MATIGSIAVAFEAELGGLKSGVSEAVGLLGELSSAVESLSAVLSGLASQKITLTVDSSELSKAKEDAESLKKSATAAQTVIKVSADSSEVKEAAAATAGLGDASDQAEAATTKVRGSIAQFVVTSAKYTSAILVAAKNYTELRERTLGYIQSVTSAKNASEAMAVVQSALRGNTASIRVVMDGVRAAATGYAKSFFDAKGATAALDVGLRATARAMGITDSALVESISYLTQWTRSQVASAAVSATKVKSLQLLGGAFKSAAQRVEEFFARSEAGTKIGSSLAGAIDSVAPVVGKLNKYFDDGVAATAKFLSRFDATAAVTKATSASLNAVTQSVSAFASGAKPLTDVMGAVTNGLSAFAGGVAKSAAVVGPYLNLLGNLATGYNLVAAAASEDEKGKPITAAAFAAVAGRAAATTVAIAALTTGIRASIGGWGFLTGAALGARQAISGLVTAFPLFAAASIGAAVATGRFHHELEELSVKAQQIDQMADRFGAPRVEIEKLRLAAQNTGVGLTQLARGQQNFFTSLSKIKAGQMNVENVREAKIAFDALDISMSQLKNSRPDEVFKMVAERLFEIEDPAKRTQVAFDLFGRQGAMILPALKEFGELSSDFDRLGGSIAQIDFDRLLTLENSFDRQKTAAANLGKVLLLPFVEFQKAFNNLSADLKGGLATALAPVMSLLADMTKPFAVIIEVAGRMINILLRITAVVTTLFAGFSRAVAIADIFSGIQQGINAALAPIEQFVGMLQKLANIVTERIGPFQVVFMAIGRAIGFVVAGLAQLITYVALGAAAWIVYSAAVSVATGAATVATKTFTKMWLAALGPVGLVVGGLLLVGAAISALTAGASSVAKQFHGASEAAGLFGRESEKINAAAASTEELAAAAAMNAASKPTEQFIGLLRDAVGWLTGWFGAVKTMFDSIGNAAGFVISKFAQLVSAANKSVGQIKASIFGPVEATSTEEIATAVGNAREEIGGLIIRAAQFGSAGEEAATAAQKSFNELQQKFADGKITLEEFEEETGKVRKKLEENLDVLTNDSPEATLKKNLELYKSLGDAAKQSGKQMRDAMADVKIGDNFFPRSEEVKAKAQEFQDKYAAALEAIKKKQQAGDFGRELTAKKKKNQDDLDAGRITKEQFEAVKLRLDSTTAQEEAQKAAEDAKRTLEKDMSSLDLSFADDIRKQLEDAFKSPVEKFQKELDKVRANKDLTSDEKAQAEKMLRKNAREGIIGKTAGEKFDERSRDIKQAQAAGLINGNEAAIEAAKNADELAKALGLPVDPSNAMKVATLQLTEAFAKGKISAQELAKGLSEARRSFLESLGIKEKPQEADKRRLEELQKQRDAGRISDEEFARGRQAIENDIIGQSPAERMREQRARIEQGMANGTVDNARGQSALRGLDREKKQAAGLDLTAGEQMQASADKINEAFGVVGYSLEEIQATLSPKEFAEYEEAVKKGREAAMASIGVQKSAADVLADSQKKLNQAVKDGVISTSQAAEASRKLKDDFMSAIGVTKTPMEQAASQLKNIAAQFGMADKPIAEVRRALAGTPEKLALFERALKQTRDNLLQSLGIEKSPQEQFDEQMKKIDEAVAKGPDNGGISEEEGKRARQVAERKRAEAIGAGDAPGVQAQEFARRQREVKEVFSAERAKLDSQFGVSGMNDNDAAKRLRETGKSNEYNVANRALREQQEAAMRNLASSMPGADADSPVRKFRDQMKTLEKLKASGVFGDPDSKEAKAELSKRKLNLQAQLQEDLKPALDRLKPDRRAVESGGDARSKSGVDTFFRILRGRDNPGLKAQLDTARATKEIAEAMKEPDAAPVVLQLQAAR